MERAALAHGPPANLRPRDGVLSRHAHRGGLRHSRQSSGARGGADLESAGVDRGFRPANSDEVEARLGSADAKVICCGHSHVPAAVRSRKGQLIVNPGSVGLQAYDDDHPFAYKVENGSPDARYAILEERNGSWSVQLRRVPYDFAPMAALARERNRPEWAAGLTTGYL
jgi:hypothetical protein